MTDQQFGGDDGLPSWFARVPTRAIMDHQLTHADLRVLACICAYANNQGFAWPNQSTIIKRIKSNQSAIDKAMIKLKKRGHLKVVSRHRSHKKWRRVMGNVYRIVFDQSLETDKLIADMNHEDTMTDRMPPGGPQKPVQSDLEDPGSQGPENGDRNQRAREEEEELVEAVMVARRYAQAALRSHGQLRLVDDRAVEAARRHLADGFDGDAIIRSAELELERCRAAGRDAPHHVGNLEVEA